MYLAYGLIIWVKSIAGDEQKAELICPSVVKVHLFLKLSI